MVSRMGQGGQLSSHGKKDAAAKQRLRQCPLAGYAMQEVHKVHETQRLLSLNAFQRHQKFVAGKLNEHAGPYNCCRSSVLLGNNCNKL